MKTNKVLETTRKVIEKSKHVSIDLDRAREFAHNLSNKDITPWLAQCPIDLSELNEKDKISFLFVFNSLSFCYWGNPKWAVNYHNKDYDRGTWSMIAALKRAIEEGIPILDSGYLSKMNLRDLESILRANTQIPLIKKRLASLNQLGRVTINKYNGSFRNIISSSDNNAVNLTDKITNDFDLFRDYTFYNGKKVYFNKRAQLLASDIARVDPVVKDSDKLTACADYKLPLILREHDILKYDIRLRNKVDNDIELSSDSEEVTEIRANTIWAVEAIKDELRKKMPEITSIGINDYLWLNAGEISKTSYFKTRTSAF